MLHCTAHIWHVPSNKTELECNNNCSTQSCCALSYLGTRCALVNPHFAASTMTLMTSFSECCTAHIWHVPSNKTELECNNNCSTQSCCALSYLGTRCALVNPHFAASTMTLMTSFSECCTAHIWHVPSNKTELECNNNCSTQSCCALSYLGTRCALVNPHFAASTMTLMTSFSECCTAHIWHVPSNKTELECNNNCSTQSCCALSYLGTRCVLVNPHFAASTMTLMTSFSECCTAHIWSVSSNKTELECNSNCSTQSCCALSYLGTRCALVNPHFAASTMTLTASFSECCTAHIWHVPSNKTELECNNNCSTQSCCALSYLGTRCALVNPHFAASTMTLMTSFSECCTAHIWHVPSNKTELECNSNCSTQSCCALSYLGTRCALVNPHFAASTMTLMTSFSECCTAHIWHVPSNKTELECNNNCSTQSCCALSYLGTRCALVNPHFAASTMTLMTSFSECCTAHIWHVPSNKTELECNNNCSTQSCCALSYLGTRCALVNPHFAASTMTLTASFSECCTAHIWHVPSNKTELE